MSIDNSFAEVYEQLLRDLYLNPEYGGVKPRNQEINEILGSTMIFDPRKCLYENKRRSSQLKYIAAEFVWYFNKSQDVNFINKFSSFWNNIVNPDNRTVNSAYGHLIFNELHSYNWIDNMSTMTSSSPSQAYMTQWNWAIKQLTTDKDTRQAILHYNKPHHQFNGNKDFVCTIYQIFFIRNNQLHSHVHMRSTDAILGLPTDVAWFSTLQINLYNLLKEKYYPELELGLMTHISDSMHFYNRNLELVKEMIKYPFVCGAQIPEMGIMINEYNVTSEFMKGLYYAISNPDNFNIKSVNSEFEFWMLDKLELINKKDE